MKDIKQGVEDFGVTFEKFGRTPMQGRVFAYLLLSGSPQLSELYQFFIRNIKP